MAVQNTRRNSAYGLSDALVNVFPAPIVARRIPTTHDMAQIGTLWIDSLNDDAYVLTSVQGNVATWVSFNQGAATFDSLTVNPGPTDLTGAVTIDTANAAFDLATGTGAVNISTDATLNSINIGTGAGEKNISIGNNTALTQVIITADDLQLTSGDAPLTLTGNTGGIAITAVDSGFDLETGTGAINIGRDAVAHDIVIGNQTGDTSVEIAAGTGGITLLSDGIVAVSPVSSTTTFPAVGTAVNANIGSIVFDGYTTAAGSSVELLFLNALVTEDSLLLVTASNLGTNDAQMSVTRVFPSAGQFLVTLKNVGTQALNGDFRISFWLLD